jgi:RNA polymerase sigma factor (sigma-70 family)
MASASPSGQELVALARARLRDELRALSAFPADELRRRLLQVEPETSVTRGALVHAIRAAVDAGEDALAQALFVALTRRIEGLTRNWVRRTALSAGLDLAPEDWREVASDLAQDQTLRLWDAIARGDDEGWELFFGRALAFAQGHLAEAWLRRMRPRAGGRVLPPPMSLSSADDEDDFASAMRAAQVSADGLAGADLSDLRALVERLPERERTAVVLRFWVGAGEDTIAQALGGVTTRTVRNTLRRAYARLRAWYAGGDEAAATPGAGE